MFPVAFLILAECLLRLSHYGPDLSLFTTITIGGEPFRVMNPAVKYRYFSQVWFNPATSPEPFRVPKPPGTYRIFCLGGSTTVGYPYWYNGAFSSFLRARLTRIFPNRSIEVINVGMTATNSFTVLDMASDIMNESPDLIIVYDGHNEFYGALGVASRDAWELPRWMTRLALRLIHLRMVYLLREAISGIRGLFGGSGELARGTMMERLAYGRLVPYRSGTYNTALEEFSGNITELKRLCSEKSIPLILSTQVSNLHDLAPFVSGPVSGRTPEEQTRFNTILNDAIAMNMDGRTDSAKSLFLQAEAIDPFRAETRYDHAQCLDASGDKEAARADYIRARDFDQLRFRASSDFNNVIRSATDGERYFLADIEKMFMGASPDSLVGTNLLFEHVHPRSEGAFLMARCYADVMRTHGLLSAPDQWRAADTISEASLWSHRPLTQLDEAIALRRTEILMSGWPFQPIDRPPDEVPAGNTLAAIADSVVVGELGWDDGHRSAASYEERKGDTTLAGADYRLLLKEYLLVSGEFSKISAVSSLSYAAAKARYLQRHASAF